MRGSSGYGKTFLKLDNGYQREDAHKDIGTLLDWIKTQPGLDSDRVMVFGESYGGYLALILAIIVERRFELFTKNNTGGVFPRPERDIRSILKLD